MIATSIEQSKKLIDLGLNPETADSHTEMIDINGDMVSQLMEGHGDTTKRNFGTLCWSLNGLFTLMPEQIKERSEYFLKIKRGLDKWEVLYSDRNDSTIYGIYGDTPLDAAYNMVVWLLEKGYIKTEKK